MIHQSGLIVSIFCVFCNGFLLDDKTTPPTEIVTGNADHRYDALVTLLMTEREDRIKLEKEVALLKKELLNTQQGVTDLYHSHNKLNETVKTNYEMCIYKTNSLQNELKPLKQLQSISDLQSVLDLQNQTKLIEKQVEVSNTQLNQIRNEVNAEKQEFIALFNKADATEKKVRSSFETLNKSQNALNSSFNSLQLEFKALESEQQRQLENLNKSKNALELELKTLETEQHHQQSQLQMRLNSSSQHLEQRLNDLQKTFSKQPNRVAVTACGSDGTYQRYSQIKFPSIKTSRGISSAVSSNLANTGTFTCEKAGLYLISVFITSNEDRGYICLRKNGDNIAISIFSVHYIQTNSVTMLYNLDINDKLTLTSCSGPAQFISGFPYSCMSILQLSD